MKIKIISFLLLLLILIPIKGQTQESGTDELKQRAIEAAQLLENAIKEVIEYGKKGWDATTLIEDTILPNFITDGTIQTKSLSGITNTSTYKRYFEKIHKRALKDPDIEVDFISIEVLTIDKFRFKTKVRFKQRYETGVYCDITIKETEIKMVPTSDGSFRAVIGNTVIPHGVPVKPCKDQ